MNPEALFKSTEDLVEYFQAGGKIKRLDVSTECTFILKNGFMCDHEGFTWISMPWEIAGHDKWMKIL